MGMISALIAPSVFYQNEARHKTWMINVNARYQKQKLYRNK